MTTVDVLAAYGRQFHAVVPAQIGYSRGADGLIVRNEIKKINDLKGKVIATSQFTEADFFMRYLAQEAGLQVNPLNSLDATPSADRVNLVYTEEGPQAGELFLSDLKSGRNRLAGAMTWEPTVSEVVEQSGGVAKVLIDEQESARGRGRARAASRVRRSRTRRSWTAWSAACSRATAWCVTTGTRTSTRWPAPSSGRATMRARSSARCTSPTCPRASRSSRAQSTPPAASAASTSRLSSRMDRT